jgi:hypothetical protein
MPKHHFRVIDGCPCPERVAPYIALVTIEQGFSVNSVYRGDDARAILNRHGHQSQAQLYEGWVERRPGYNPANPPGHSTHELKSDGVAYPDIPSGDDLEFWMQGFDVDDSEVEDVKHQAAIRGWELFQPYDSTSEFHHLNFKHRPGPSPHGVRVHVTEHRIEEVRNQLPRR